MKEKSKIALDEAILEYAKYIELQQGQKNRFPKAIKKRVSELSKLGISVSTLAISFGVSRSLVYQWLKIDKKKASAGLLPKRLRIKEDSINRKDPLFESKIINPSFGRLIFRSGIQLELSIQSIDVQFLNLLNELGQ